MLSYFLEKQNTLVSHHFGHSRFLSVLKKHQLTSHMTLFLFIFCMWQAGEPKYTKTIVGNFFKGLPPLYGSEPNYPCPPHTHTTHSFTFNLEKNKLKAHEKISI